VSVVGKEVEDEGKCLVSCGLLGSKREMETKMKMLGSKGEMETKMKMRYGKEDKHVFEDVWRGRGGHLAVVLHRKETLVCACVTQELGPRACW
jgi:hypothetical protein